MTALYKHPDFKRGILDMASSAPGIAAWGLMTGVAMIKSGLSLTETLLMAVLVFAGSSQLAALPLIVAGAPMWVVLATGFCVAGAHGPFPQELPSGKWLGAAQPEDRDHYDGRWRRPPGKSLPAHEKFERGARVLLVSGTGTRGVRRVHRQVGLAA